MGHGLRGRKLAAAIIDRIVHHGRLLEFTGQSRRVSEALMFGRNTSAQPENKENACNCLNPKKIHD